MEWSINISQILHASTAHHSPLRKLCSKNPKVALNLSKLCKNFGKIALKLRAIWLIFGCNILVWSFDTLANFGNKQKNNVCQYYTGLMKCKVDNDGLYCKLRCNVISLATLSSGIDSKKVWRQEVAIFGQTATYFKMERLWVLRGPICPRISPKWKIISAKTARNLPKLPSMAKIAWLHENTKVALRNIAIFWWD